MLKCCPMSNLTSFEVTYEMKNSIALLEIKDKGKKYLITASMMPTLFIFGVPIFKRVIFFFAKYNLTDENKNS